MLKKVVLVWTKLYPGQPTKNDEALLLKKATAKKAVYTVQHIQPFL
jgi:hypothetical protein